MNKDTPPYGPESELEPEYEKRAEQIFEVMEKGGLCLIRLDVGYALIGTKREAIEKIFELKKRPRERNCVVLGTSEIFREITMSQYKEQATEIDLPVALIDKINHESKYAKDIPPEVIVDDTIAVFINTGEQANVIAQYAFNKESLVYGSSANLSGAGNHYRLQDVEGEIRGAVDLEFDDGDVRYQDFWPDGRGMSGTIIDLVQHKLARKGLLLDKLTDKARALKIIE